MARSNRQLTQFAVDKLRQAMVYGPAGLSKSAMGNTEVEVDECSNCDRPSHLVVRLYGKDIMRILFSPVNPRVVAGILIRTGDFYDSKGRSKYINVKRTQFPLMPALAMPLYSMQGSTADPGMVAYWFFPQPKSEMAHRLCHT